MQNYKSLEEWLEELAKRESSGRYFIENNYGYLGKYQMGEAALSDVGYYNGHSKGYKQEWSGKFTGKDNVYSKEDFLNNPQAQENAIRDYMKKQWNYLKSEKSDQYIGKRINNIEITPSGLLTGAHLNGFSEAGKYLRSFGRYIPKDGNGTSIEEYLQKFGGYDVSEITNPNYYSPNFEKTKSDIVKDTVDNYSKTISKVANEVMPSKPISGNVINNAKITPPLTEEEWLRRLRRSRMGL